MPSLTFIDHEGMERTVAAEIGQSLMEAARNNAVPGIDATCGGMGACATCHVFVEEAFLARTGAPSEGEQEMLEFVSDARANSRLACQIELTADLDGMRIFTPAEQG